MSKQRTTVETRAEMANAITAQAIALVTLLTSAEAELLDARTRLAQLAADHEIMKRRYDEIRLKVHALANDPGQRPGLNPLADLIYELRRLMP